MKKGRVFQKESTLYENSYYKKSRVDPILCCTIIIEQNRTEQNRIKYNNNRRELNRIFIFPQPFLKVWWHETTLYLMFFIIYCTFIQILSYTMAKLALLPPMKMVCLSVTPTAVDLNVDSGHWSLYAEFRDHVRELKASLSGVKGEFESSPFNPTLTPL